MNHNQTIHFIQGTTFLFLLALNTSLLPPDVDEGVDFLNPVSFGRDSVRAVLQVIADHVVSVLLSDLGGRVTLLVLEIRVCTSSHQLLAHGEVADESGSVKGTLSILCKILEKFETRENFSVLHLKNYLECRSLTGSNPRDGLYLRSSPTTAEWPLWAALNKAVAPS